MRMSPPSSVVRFRLTVSCLQSAHPHSSQSHGVETIEPLNEAHQVEIPEVSAGGYEVPSYRPPIWVPPETIPGPTHINAEAQSTISHAGPAVSQLEAEIGKEDLEPDSQVQRPGLGQRHHSVLHKMTPHLQFMAGPMLTYHTVKDSVWHGAAMIVRPFPYLPRFRCLEIISNLWILDTTGHRRLRICL